LSRRDALLLVILVWLSNQLVGFIFLDYPRTASAFAWGAVLGIVAILATVAGQWLATRFAHAARPARCAATFIVAFAVYESVLFAVSATLLGGTEIYTAAIQGRIFLINAAAFFGLLALNHLTASLGLAKAPAVTPAMTERHV
jgi:hypothetical protein